MSKIYLLILFLIFPSVKRSESTEVEMINKFTTQNSTTNELPITTENPCNYNEDPSYFTCSGRGRYPNLNDPSCETYYLCNLLKNGSFVQTLYKCPKTSFFNPPKQVCDISYQCPCSKTTSTVVSTTETEKPVTQSRSTEVETTIEQVTKSKSTQAETTIEFKTDKTILEVGTTYTPPFSTTEYICEYNEDPSYFTCSSKGRYPNLNDPSCETYYLCNQLRNVSFTQTLYKCPKTSFFNPFEQVCDFNYPCPCSTSTNTAAIMTVPETETDKFISTTERNAANEIKTSTTGNDDIGSIFTCPSDGIFSDPEDTNCEYFYVCISSYSSLLSIRSKCPEGTTFDTLFGVCSPFYICPNNSKPLSDLDHCTTKHSMNYICNANGTYVNPNDITCRTYYLCSLQENGTFIQILQKCPATFLYNPTSKTCDAFYKCPCSTTFSTKGVDDQVTESGITESGKPEFSCTSTGVFKDPLDQRCKRFYVCIQSFLLYISVYASCPSGTLFDPLLRLCSPFYSCPHISKSTTTTAEPLTTVKNKPTNEYGTSVTERIEHEFVCFSTGIFEDPQDLECKKYYVCTKSFLLYVSVHSTCPPATFFDPLLRLCSPFYSCPHVPMSTTTTFEHLTNEPIDKYRTSKTEKKQHEFVCSSTGIFEDTQDFECKKYYICTKSFLLYVSVHSTCPPGTLFDPLLRLCSPFYSCPHIQKSTSTTIEVPSTSITNNCTSIASSHFTCFSNGKYPNLNDLTCSTYYICKKLIIGSFSQTLQSCPIASYFNPVTHACEVNYKCKCNTITDTTIFTNLTNESETSNGITTSMSNEKNDIAFTCLSTGIFQDESDLTCRQFYVCIRSLMSFISIHSTCPTGTFFDPSHRMCSQHYSCPHISKTTSDMNEFTTSERDHCKHVNDSKYSTCSTEGKYPNLMDFTCQTYYSCTLLRNGLFNRSIYTCPFMSFFNPVLQVCEYSYKCPCTTSTASQTERMEFFCPSVGVFADSQDSTCRKFHVCIRFSLSYLSIYSTCPEGTFFDHTFRICSPYYSCQHQLNTTKNIQKVIEMKEVTRIIDSSTDEYAESTTSLSIHLEDSEPIQSSSVTPEEDSCNQLKDPLHFNCSSQGIYPNLNDHTCRTYYICKFLENGSFHQMLYDCPKKSNFNPRSQMCDVNYICPCSVTKRGNRLVRSIGMTGSDDKSVTEGIENDSEVNENVIHDQRRFADLSSFDSSMNICEYSKPFTCNSSGRFPNWNDTTCRTYYLCVPTKSGSFEQIPYTCPTGSFFCPQLKLCYVNYKCPCSSEKRRLSRSIGSERPVIRNESANTSKIMQVMRKKNDSKNAGLSHNLPTASAYTGTIKIFTCNRRSRFPNWNDPTCETYYLCVPLKTGSFVQIQYKCPQGSCFCPLLRVCSVNYKCPCSPDKTRFTRSVDAERFVSENGTTNEVGVDDNEEKMNASSNLLQFRPLPKVCAYNKNLKPFTCYVRGRFPNWNDPTCRSYYLCVPLRTGYFVQTRYTCPKGSFFCPILRVCNVNYECPCSTGKEIGSRK
nr:uncharacterized protein LOC111509189 [Leptinotarsa decemlineata]